MGRDRGIPLHGRLMYLLHNNTTKSISYLAKILAIKIAQSYIKVLLASMGRNHDLTTAQQNFRGKLSEAFTIGFDDVAIHIGSRPYFVI